MMHIFKCKNCGIYTIKEKCPKCGMETVRPIPPKYSPVDKYGKYRRKFRFESLKEQGFI